VVLSGIVLMQSSRLRRGLLPITYLSDRPDSIHRLNLRRIRERNFKGFARHCEMMLPAMR